MALGLALSPYLFTLVMDEVTRDIEGKSPRCMLFADDDVVLVDDRISRIKTRYMRCGSSTTRHEEKVSLDGQLVPQKYTF